MTLGNEREKRCLLTVNAGSSSIKFALFEMNASLSRTVSGKIDRIGLPGATLSVTELASRKMEQVDLDATKHADCVAPLLSAIERQSVCRP